MRLRLLAIVVLVGALAAPGPGQEPPPPEWFGPARGVPAATSAGLDALLSVETTLAVVDGAGRRAIAPPVVGSAARVDARVIVPRRLVAPHEYEPALAALVEALRARGRRVEVTTTFRSHAGSRRGPAETWHLPALRPDPGSLERSLDLASEGAGAWAPAQRLAVDAEGVLTTVEVRVRAGRTDVTVLQTRGRPEGAWSSGDEDATPVLVVGAAPGSRPWRLLARTRAALAPARRRAEPRRRGPAPVPAPPRDRRGVLRAPALGRRRHR